MTRMREFALPDLGEGLTEGEILQWLVSPGETVALNQPLVEVETAKAAVEIPSPFAGVVAELLVQAGATVDVGSTIVRFDTDPAAGPVEGQGAAAVQAAGAAANPAESSSAVAAAARGGAAADDWSFGAAPAGGSGAGPAEDADGGAAAPLRPSVGSGREAVLVGYGVRPGAARRRTRVASQVPSTTAASPPVPPVPPARVSAAAVAVAAERNASVDATPPPRPARASVLAKPPVRQLAKTLGVDLNAVRGSGAGGVVTRQDVEGAASPGRQVGTAGAAGVAGAAGAAGVAHRDVARERIERRIPIKGVRRATAQAMVASAFTAPHVTLFATVDVTPTMDLVARLRQAPELAGTRVSPLLLVARALLLACSRHPEVNASWDEAAQEIVVHGAVHLGIAAATPRGLLVPNVKDADTLGLVALARALDALAVTAREGRTTPAEMTGGTITITNVGSFGVDNGTPILNPGEAAILCLGAIRPTPWVHEGAVAVREVTQLALSFDHRLVDGALGAAVLSDVGAALADPTRLLLWA